MPAPARGEELGHGPAAMGGAEQYDAGGIDPLHGTQGGQRRRDVAGALRSGERLAGADEPPAGVRVEAAGRVAVEDQGCPAEFGEYVCPERHVVRRPVAARQEHGHRDADPRQGVGGGASARPGARPAPAAARPGGAKARAAPRCWRRTPGRRGLRRPARPGPWASAPAAEPPALAAMGPEPRHGLGIPARRVEHGDPGGDVVLGGVSCARSPRARISPAPCRGRAGAW